MNITLISLDAFFQPWLIFYETLHNSTPSPSNEMIMETNDKDVVLDERGKQYLVDIRVIETIALPGQVIKPRHVLQMSRR